MKTQLTMNEAKGGIDEWYVFALGDEVGLLIGDMKIFFDCNLIEFVC